MEPNNQYLKEMLLSPELPLVAAAIKVISTIDSMKGFYLNRFYQFYLNHRTYVVKQAEPREICISLSLQDYKMDYMLKYIGWFFHDGASYLVSKYEYMFPFNQVVPICEAQFVIDVVKKVVRTVIVTAQKYNFAHNDLYDNVLINNNTYEPYIIDFEFSTFNNLDWKTDLRVFLDRLCETKHKEIFKPLYDAIETSTPEQFLTLLGTL